MQVIIFAYAKENHTAPVKWALEQAGYQVACWGGLSWTEQQQASLLLDAQTKMIPGPFTVEPGDAIWVRRPRLEEFPAYKQCSCINKFFRGAFYSQ